MKTQERALLESSPTANGRVEPFESPPRPRKRKRPWLLWLTLGIALATAGTWAWRSVTALPEVAVEPATMGELWTSFTAEGVVRGKEHVLSAENGGRIASVGVREGDPVRRGQVLVRLNASNADALILQARAGVDAALRTANQGRAELRLVRERYAASLAAAQAQVKQADLEHRLVLSGARPEEIAQAGQHVIKARALRDEAAQSHQRVERLYREGAIAKASLERAEASLRTAEADLREAELAERLLLQGPSAEVIAVSEAALASALAGLQQARSEARQVDVAQSALRASDARVTQAMAELQRVNSLAREQVITAPADGTITRLHVELGSVALPGSPIAILSSREDLRIEAEISTEDIAKITPATKLKVTCAAYPGRTFTARLAGTMPSGELKPDAAIRTRIVRARVELLNSNAAFRPGMEVDVEGSTHVGIGLSVPSEAVRLTGDAPTVFVLEAGKVVEKVVTLGRQESLTTEILSGLRVGQLVVVRGGEELKSGDRVRAVR